MSNAAHKLRVLWLSPIHSHYKARFLEHWQENGQIQLTVLAGQMQRAKGFSEAQEPLNYSVERVPVVSTKFGISLAVAQKVLQLCRRTAFDFIMIPADRKRLPLMLWLVCWRPVFGYQLFSYNHARSGKRGTGSLMGTVDRWLTRWMYALLDRIVFYTDHEKEVALGKKLLPPQKAFYANNTLDTDEIRALCPSEPEVVTPPAMLFIGRLVADKRVHLALQYHREIKKSIPGFQLIVVGDGPDAVQVKQAAQTDPDIIWTGTLSEEQQISVYMRRASFVFNPGSVGLSIAHAFAYGKPLITLRERPGTADKMILHGPEICYLRPGENGLLLEGEDIQTDCQQMLALLSDPNRCRTMAYHAMETSRRISVKQWTEQMTHSLTAQI